MMNINKIKRKKRESCINLFSVNIQIKKLTQKRQL